MIETTSFSLSTKGFTDIIDITPKIEEFLDINKHENAQMSVYVMGSTVGVTTMEYEPNLLKDFHEVFELVAPQAKEYFHDKFWEEKNAYAHILASIIGNSVSIPIIKSNLELGTWQKVVLIDFDNKPRVRSVFVQIIT
jgi:secondary thiamine-phosphate synthase enzyme